MASTSWAQRCSTLGQAVNFLRALLGNKAPLFLRTEGRLFSTCINGLDLIIHPGNKCKLCSCLQ